MPNSTIYTSLEYGCYRSEGNEYNEDEGGKTYDICDELGSNIEDYRLKKICYSLSEKYNIIKIKMEYINKNDNTLKVLETPTYDGMDGKYEEYELEDDEEIINVKVYVNNIILLGFEIISNKGKNKKIGFGEEFDVITEKDLEKGEKVVVGFGFNSSKKFGVYSLHFYYIDKK